jgi:hypothetical protein
MATKKVSKKGRAAALKAWRTIRANKKKNGRMMKKALSNKG